MKPPANPTSLDGAVLVVDRARAARHGAIVVAVVDNALTVKELDTRGPIPWRRCLNSRWQGSWR